MTRADSHRLTLYVRSVEVPSSQFVEKELTKHHCTGGPALAEAQFRAASQMIGRAFPDSDWQAICIGRAVAASAGVELEIVDLRATIWRRMKLYRKGIRTTPRFEVDGCLLPTMVSTEQLRTHLRT